MRATRPGDQTTVDGLKIIILGGYGLFGGRLVELLSDIADLEIVVCGRDLAKATKFCKGINGRAKVWPIAFDRNALVAHIGQIAPQIVVDASGPFQDYGKDRYSVVRTCIDAGVNYLDFADGADFVFGISQFDQQARKTGVVVLSGVSSFPVLTAAVIREMARHMDVVSVSGGIAPSPYAGIGLNVMRAVAGYAGAPVKLVRNGVEAEGIGIGESMRFTIAPPGKLPLNNLHFSLVDVPDLRVIPREHKTIRDIWMGAGPVPEVLHKSLNFMAKARSSLRLPSLAPLAPIFYRVLNLCRFGEHRGGMFVRAKGLKNQRPFEISWHLLAEGDDGPYIPSMAIEAVIRKFLAGDKMEPGARPATRALKLADYDKLFAERAIFTGFRRSDDPSATIYQHVLGSSFASMPEPLKRFHGSTSTRQWRGIAEVKRGRGLLANLLASAIGFPTQTEETPVAVTVTVREDGELWERNFGGKRFSSLQSVGRDRNKHLLIETFGPFKIALALVREADRLYLVPRSWTFFGIPMPRVLLPAGESFETEKDGKFRFDVTISAPVVGMIVAYNGLLEPV